MTAVFDNIPASLIEAWKQRVLSGVRVRNPGDADLIARRCAEAEWRGDRHVAVWHEAAAFYDRPCHCWNCGFVPTLTER